MIDMEMFASNRGPVVNLPVSKSIGARYLVASYFAGTLSDCRRYDDCDDLLAIQRALEALPSFGSVAEGEGLVDVRASGTAFRFLSAVIASLPGADFTLTGTPRLCSRPMAPLIDVLRKAGAAVEGLGDDGRGPFRIRGARLTGGDFEIRGDISSQFISALMLVAPMWERGMRLKFTTQLVSRPYVEMTAGVMRRFGLTVNLTEDAVEVSPGRYHSPEDFCIESDWSSASYFYAANCFRHGVTFMPGLLPSGESLQGDSSLVEFFAKLGIGSVFRDGGVAVERVADAGDYVEIDLADNPDLMPALAIGCLLQATRFKFTGVRNLRLKECDRLLAMKTEIEKMGYPIVVGDDSIEWRGGAWPVPDTVVDTYDDHRIAMAFAVMAEFGRDMLIAHPEVVGKSFPGFWDCLGAIGLECSREGDVMRVSKIRCIPDVELNRMELKDTLNK